MTSRILVTAALVLLFIPALASAQSLEAAAHVASSQWSEFEGNDLGVGGRVTSKPSSLIGVDAEMTWYRSDFPDGIAFTRSRVEGLFGATVGPRLNRIRPFAKVAAGFLKVGATPGAFACIAIFPPPLNCALAGGDTLPAFEVGGGVEVDATSRTFIRVDVTDRMLKYPGPTFDPDFEIHEEGFFGHALRLTVGAGVRF
jgi:hypothetical protein